MSSWLTLFIFAYCCHIFISMENLIALIRVLLPGPLVTAYVCLDLPALMVVENFMPKLFNACILE